jgi:hypothetical protein
VLVDQIYDEGYPIAVTCHHGPDVGYDEYSNEDAAGRISDLGINLYPTLVPDGQPEPPYPYTYDGLTTLIDERMAVPAPCTIGLSGFLIDDQLTVNVSVYQDDGADIPDPRVQVVITESSIPYPDPNYNNELNFVNRDMVLDYMGTPITFEDNFASVSVSSQLDAAWNWDNITVVAFVENSSTLEIFQTMRSDMSVFLYDPGTPAQPEDFVVVVNENGELNCDISWTNPSLTYSGETLNELLEVRLYRDDELIYTDYAPVIGGSGSYYDEVDSSGSYVYAVAGYNSIGEGPPAFYSAWIGEDVPNVVEDLLLVDQNGTGYITWTNPTTGLHGGAFNNPITGYDIMRSDGELFEITGSADEFLDDTIPEPDYYYYTVTPINDIGDGGTATSNTEWIGDDFSGIVILDLDPTPTGTTLQNSIMNYYPGVVVVTDDVNAYPLTSNVDAVFVLLGIYSSNYVLTENEASILTIYLDNGGNVYMEGGDTWYYDSQTSLQPYFNINATTDGSGDAGPIEGMGFLEGYNWTYSGENSWIDHLEPIAPAFTIFHNITPSYNNGIAYESRSYRTVGTSFEITGLGGDYTLDDAVYGILEFFDVLSGSEADDPIIPVVTELKQNYPNPFNPETTISFALNTSDHVEIEVFNLVGQKVKTLIKEDIDAGYHSIIWNGTDDSENQVASGIYLYKLKTGRYTSTKKMILMK